MRKRIIAGLLIFCMAATGCSKSSDETATDIDTVELKSNQEIVIAKINQIAGNEITYTVAEEMDGSEEQDKRSGRNSESELSEETENGESNRSFKEGASNGEGKGASGEEGQMQPPSGEGENMQSKEDGNMPPQMEQEQEAGKEKRKDSSESSSEGGDKEQQTMYTLTDETATMLIPVGTAVITSLGNETTFSRLSNGDVIKMILEEDGDGNKVIVGIWMM